LQACATASRGRHIENRQAEPGWRAPTRTPPEVGGRQAHGTPRQKTTPSTNQRSA
jgi:hypothetical protein